MLRETENMMRALFLIGVLGLSSLAFLPSVNAAELKPVPGEFTVVLVGADPNTGEMIFEGFKTGAIPGHLNIRVGITRQTGVILHLAARWTLTTPWGETMDGETSLILNTETLHFNEHGVIVAAEGSLAARVGNFIIIHGDISDLLFYPGMTTVTGHALIVPSQGKRYK